jgi:hypothetical protein
MHMDPVTAAVCVPIPTCSTTGSVRLGTVSLVDSWIFFCFLLSINRCGYSKEPAASINRLMEVDKATTLVNPPLIMTFD